MRMHAHQFFNSPKPRVVGSIPASRTRSSFSGWHGFHAGIPNPSCFPPCHLSHPWIPWPTWFTGWPATWS